jgi:hypothetical protein
LHIKDSISKNSRLVKDIKSNGHLFAIAGDSDHSPPELIDLFSEKLVFEKGRVATTPFTEPIQVLFKISKVLQGSKNRQEVKINLLSTSAPPTDKSCNHFLSDLSNSGLEDFKMA